MTGKKAKPKPPELAGVLDAVLDVSRRQAKIIEEMRAALDRGDNEEALNRARELTGVRSKRGQSK
jgi:hypothetical protein